MNTSTDNSNTSINKSNSTLTIPHISPLSSSSSHHRFIQSFPSIYPYCPSLTTTAAATTAATTALTTTTRQTTTNNTTGSIWASLISTFTQQNSISSTMSSNESSPLSLHSISTTTTTTTTTSTSTTEEANIPIEILIVDTEASKELQCGICLQLLQRPRQCKNGHLFCQECIERCLMKNQVCPSCRCFLSFVELGRSLFVERHLRQLKLYCSNRFKQVILPPTTTTTTTINNNNNLTMRKKQEEGETYEVDERGCNEICTLESLMIHFSICGYTMVQCKHSIKCGTYRRHDIENHYKTTCAYRPVSCPHCLVDVLVDSLSEHEEVCLKAPVKCSTCFASLLRFELQEHEKEKCMMSLVSCPFSDSGCSKMMLRKDINKHVTENAIDHLILMQCSFSSQIKNLTSELKLKDEKIQALEKARDSKKHEAKIIWNVENYSVARKKNYLQSEKFQFAGFPWFIGFYTDGDNDDCRGYISIYLFLDEKYAPKNKSVSIEFTIRFINQKDPLLSIKKDFKITFPIVAADSSKRKSGWGDRRALKNTHLDATRNLGFILDDDCLHVELDLSLKHTQWLL